MLHYSWQEINRYQREAAEDLGMCGEYDEDDYDGYDDDYDDDYYYDDDEDDYLDLDDDEDEDLDP